MNKIEWRSYYREQRVLRNEIWKDISGYEGRYIISNHGRVGSIIYKKFRILKIQKNRIGYSVVRLSMQSGVKRTHTVHRLVMHAFIGKKNIDINHKNGIKECNILNNLEYITHADNIRHAFNYGLITRKKYGEHHNAKSITVYRVNGEYVGEYTSLQFAADTLGLHAQLITHVLRGRRKSTGGYTFKYKE